MLILQTECAKFFPVYDITSSLIFGGRLEENR